MKMIQRSSGPRLVTLFVYLICMKFILITTGCDDGGHGKASFESFGNKSTGTGSASFTIRWPNASALPNSEDTIVVQAIDDCESHGIATITCNVYDDSNTYLTSGGPWPCSERRGRIDEIPAGQNRRFVILGADTDGNSVYHGHSTNNITITPGEISDVGTIDVRLFVPTVSAPTDGANVTVGAFSFNWDPVENAHEYRILVSDTDSFETLIIDETTTDTTYTPLDLSPETTYYWNIHALDTYANQGAGSAVLHFMTTKINLFPPADDDTVSTDEDTAVTIDVLANDADEVGGNLIISDVTQGSKGDVTITADGESVIYTPAPNANGSDTFTYTASNGTTTDNATVVVTINPIPDSPQAGNDRFTDAQVFGVDYELNVLENDSDPDEDDTIRITDVDSTSVAGGTVTINTSGDRLIYTPAPGFFGDDTFTYTIIDGQENTATAAVTITVIAEMTRISVDSEGKQVIEESYNASISENGRFVAFTSFSDNLVAGDDNGAMDIFVYDRQTGIVERVSVASDGNQADNHSFDSEISADGRFVAFGSTADFVNGGSNGVYHVFVHDRQLKTTERVSVSSNGSEGNADSWNASISADGRLVAFVSSASNLVDGDDNGAWDIFVHNRQIGETERVSVAADGSEANRPSNEPAISNNGRFVAFESYATNLVNGDTNNRTDIFVRDIENATTERVSLATDGSEANDYSSNPSLSADGRFVVFESWATNLVAGEINVCNIYLRDREEKITDRMSVSSDGIQADNDAYFPSISADGRYVVFISEATNLVSDDPDSFADIFIHDRQDGGNTTMIGKRSVVNIIDEGRIPIPIISADGRFVAFDSYVDLVDGDTNETGDIFTAPNPFLK